MITRMGGEGSELIDVVRGALTCLTTMSTEGGVTRRSRTAWNQLRRLIACDVPRPDWPLPGGLTEQEQTHAHKDTDKVLTAMWAHLLDKAQELRVAWTHRVAPAVQAHRNAEASRGFLRVILRAWREAADDVRAGAAK